MSRYLKVETTYEVVAKMPVGEVCEVLEGRRQDERLIRRGTLFVKFAKGPERSLIDPETRDLLAGVHGRNKVFVLRLVAIERRFQE